MGIYYDSGNSDNHINKLDFNIKLLFNNFYQMINSNMNTEKINKKINKQINK